MKPKELIKQSLQNTIEPMLSQRGFRFSASSLKFARQTGDFKQEIHTHLNRYNMEGVYAEFWLSFNVSSSRYDKWNTAEYGHKPENQLLVSEMNWNLKGWKNPKRNLAGTGNVKQNMAETLEDLSSIGLPFLERYSNWENSAVRLVEQNWFHAKSCDFSLLLGNKEKAYWSLEKAIECWEKFPARTFFMGEKEGVFFRFEKHFGERRGA